MTLILPAIDLLDGCVVRVEQGDLKRSKIYSKDPVSVLEEFVEQGASMIHVVDLDAAVKSDPIRNEKTIGALLRKSSFSKFQVGGGIRSLQSASSLIRLGAARIVIGSIAYLSPETALEILENVGTSRTVLALDYDQSGMVRTHGWKKDQSETASRAVSRFSDMGFQNFLLTSIDRDGLMRGPDLEGLKEFKRITGDSRKIIASGGIATIEDIARLSEIGIEEAIVGKGLYEKKIPLSVFRTGNGEIM